MQNNSKKQNKTRKFKDTFHFSLFTFHLRRGRAGFSLVEMLVAVALFATVMLIGVGALLSLIDANKKAQSLNSVMNNLNSAMESMSRNIRVGTTYHCEVNESPIPSFSDIATPKDCDTGGKLLGFEAPKGNPEDPTDQFVYKINGTQLEMSKDSGVTWVAITAPEIVIDNFSFYVDGTDLSDNFQPRVIITIQGTAGVKEKTKTSFNLQTMISQRVLDF